MSYITDILKLGDNLFGKRENLLSFWDEIARNFNPVGADYQGRQTLGEDYAADLMTSYPLILARELNDTFSTMLRPADQVWAQMAVDKQLDYEGKAWLEWANQTQRRAMYDRKAQFVVATKEADRDFGLMGQAVLSVEVMPDKSAMLYRCWHLRDVVWCDSLSGEVDAVHRKWKTDASTLARTFGVEKLHQKVRDQLTPDKDPYCEINCRHVVVPSDLYRGERKYRTPFVSVYIDCDNEHEIEAVGVRVNPYVIPRWQRIKGSQYAVSPATVCALPEARLLQAMTYTLLEAGEKNVRPPMVATQEMIRGDIDVRAGGITWVSAEYDERMGEVLRPLTQDKSGMPLGIELQQRSEILLRQAFYLDKLDLPQRGPEMTAYEVGQRVQQYVRNALPLFEPVEFEYNGGLCEKTFESLLAEGGFGPLDDIPDSLRGEEVMFRFTSPLRDAMEKQKGQTFLEAGQLTAQAVSLDQGAGAVVDAAEALRDALEGIGVPQRWMRSPEAIQEIRDSQAQQAQADQMLAAMTQASQVAKNLEGTTGGAAA